MPVTTRPQGWEYHATKGLARVASSRWHVVLDGTHKRDTRITYQSVRGFSKPSASCRWNRIMSGANSYPKRNEGFRGLKRAESRFMEGTAVRTLLISKSDLQEWVYQPVPALFRLTDELYLGPKCQYIVEKTGNPCFIDTYFICYCKCGYLQNHLNIDLNRLGKEINISCGSY